MNKNLLTIIIEPDVLSSRRHIKPVISFRVHRRFFFLLAVMILMLMAFGSAGLLSLRHHVVVCDRMEVLQDEISRLNHVASTVADIKEDEKIIRQSLGLEAWDADFDINERLGIGGSEDNADMQIPEVNVGREIPKEENNKPLHERVRDLKGDIDQLYSVLSDMKKTLNCRPTIMPVKDSSIWITSRFGWRTGPFTGIREFHKGLDIAGRRGAHIVSTADGVVEKVGYNRYIGNFVKIKHDDRFSTIYGHLMKSVVKKGQDVTRGQLIGYMGSTGMSTGYHLHYVVIDNNKKVNPYDFILNRNEHSLASAR